MRGRRALPPGSEDLHETQKKPFKLAFTARIGHTDRFHARVTLKSHVKVDLEASGGPSGICRVFSSVVGDCHASISSSKKVQKALRPSKTTLRPPLTGLERP